MKANGGVHKDMIDLITIGTLVALNGFLYWKQHRLEDKATELRKDAHFYKRQAIDLRMDRDRWHQRFLSTQEQLSVVQD